METKLEKKVVRRQAFSRPIEPISQHKLELYRKFGYVTKAGVVYEEELAGSNGMSFVLFKDRRTTPDMLVESVKELRATRDVVGLIKVAEVKS